MSIVATPLRARVRDQLVREILGGILGPGTPLRIRDLAQKLGVSPTPVREALVGLEGDGWVDASTNRGFRVKPLDPDEVRDLYPLIWTLEAQALREAPPEGRVLDELDELNREMATVGGAWEAMTMDGRWHRTLLSGSSNKIGRELLDNLKARAMRYEVAYMRDTERVSVSREQHAAITARLRNGHLDRAVEILKENWRIGPRFLIPWLEE